MLLGCNGTIEKEQFLIHITRIKFCLYKVTFYGGGLDFSIYPPNFVNPLATREMLTGWACECMNQHRTWKFCHHQQLCSLKHERPFAFEQQVCLQPS